MHLIGLTTAIPYRFRHQESLIGVVNRILAPSLIIRRGAEILQPRRGHAVGQLEEGFEDGDPLVQNGATGELISRGRGELRGVPGVFFAEEGVDLGSKGKRRARRVSVKAETLG